VWQYQPTRTGSNPDAQYQNDPPPANHAHAWVLHSGTGYTTGPAPNYGFSQAYCDNVHDFLDLCDLNGIKVIPMLFWPRLDWENTMHRTENGDTVWATSFRKTAFDRTSDTLVYGSDQSYKYECDDPTRSGGAQHSLKDHTAMLGHYKTAVVDFLNAFGWHESVWGVDVFNEPLYFLAPPYTGSSPNTIWYWHGLGYDVYDTDQWVSSTDHHNHRLRDFLADTYDAVKTWCAEAGNRNIEVVSDIANDNYHFPMQFVDMVQTWDGTSSPVRKTCDVFGLHWYQYFDSYNPYVPDRSYLWSSDTLKDPQGIYLQTEWMAEKPLILAETIRYANMSRFDGDHYFDDTDYCDQYVCNYEWYENYLDKGTRRHIESFIFFSGDGASWDGHPVRGVHQGPSEDYSYGWGPDGDHYDLGLAGQLIYDYAPSN
jgi:hypothetical protein